jgi:hypothetical protein
MSTDVTENKNRTYTVVNAINDKDNNIYVVDKNGKRTDKIIGTTLQPFDFMSTNDSNGEFTFDKNVSGVTFDINNLTVSGTVKPNAHTSATINNADAQRLINWGKELFNEEIQRQSPNTFYGDLEILRNMAQNYVSDDHEGGKGCLDFKSSLGLPKYTAIQAGTTPNGKPIITTLRAIGNITFGANMRSIKPYLLPTAWYYGRVMQKVGEYNQLQNQGNGYNAGHPYYGEHTYSGSYIYFGYFGNFYNSK